MSFKLSIIARPLDAESGAAVRGKRVFAPLRDTSRGVQPTGKPDEYWAAVCDGEATEIGIYGAKLFNFKPLVKLPKIQIRNSGFWDDEREA